MSGVFVTGTDTEVGKTIISAHLVRLLRQQDQSVIGMKPIASGCEQTDDGLRNEDALALMAQSNVDIAYEQINPYAFAPAIAPHIAAKQVDVTIDIDQIVTGYQALSKRAEQVVVEGAGGWLVPLNDQASMADLAEALALPVVLVVAVRLGCINHALLTVEAIQQRGLSLCGWVANQVDDCDEADEIIESLRARISAPCLGVVPHLQDGESITTLQLPSFMR